MRQLPAFFPEGLPVPARFHYSGLRLEPLAPAHNALDYAAVMASREMLRLWSGSAWPADDFTPEDNEADLAWHAREHRQRIAFTYTVLGPAGDSCLGCVYIKSLAKLVAEQTANQERLTEIGEFEAAVRFWARSDQADDELEARLLSTLRGWFGEAWPFRRVLYHTRAVNRQQLALFQAAGLRCVWSLTMPQRGGVHEFWEQPMQPPSQRI